MKYLKTGYSRKRGAGLELAMMMFLAMTAVTIMVVNTTLIQIERQKQSYNELAEDVYEIDKMQIDQMAKSFVIYMNNKFQYEGKELDENGLPNIDFEFHGIEQISDEESNKTCVVSFISTSSQPKGFENTFEQYFIVSFSSVVYTEDGPEEGISEQKSQFNIKFDVVIEDGKAKYQTYTIIN